MEDKRNLDVAIYMMKHNLYDETTDPAETYGNAGGQTDVRTASQSRDRKLTEKGMSYAQDTKERQLTYAFRKLKKSCENIDRQIAENKSCDDVQSSYKEWLDDYDLFLQIHNDFVNTVSSECTEAYLTEFYESKDIFLKNFKAKLESWLSSKQAEKISERDSVSQIGTLKTRSRATGSTSTRSSISSALIREEQKRAELEIKMKALQKKRQLELDRLNLQLREKEHELETKIAISNVKSEVLTKYEANSMSNMSETQCNVKTEAKQLVGESKTAPNVNIVSESCLNPNVESYVPGQPNVTQIKQERLSDNELNYENNEYNACSVNKDQSQLPNSNVRGSSAMCDGFGFTGPAKTADQVGYTAYPFDYAHQNYHGNEPYVNDARSRPMDDVSLSLVRHLRKPNFEIRKFCGNPMEFKKFLRQFHAKVTVNADNDDEKMNFLEQFTVGEANKVVSGFSHLDASQGFSAAMNELMDRYGDNQVIAHAFISKALEWPNIRPDDAKMLDEFSLFLVECGNAAASIGAMTVLEYSENMQKLISKLPYRLHDRWRSLIRHLMKQGRKANFGDLVRFVREEAKMLMDPIYGKEAISSNQRNKTEKVFQSRSQGRNKGSFAVTTLEGDRKDVQKNVPDVKSNRASEVSKSSEIDKGKSCLYCGNVSHSLDECGKFVALHVRDRYEFLKRKGICFLCLKVGHRKKDCRSKYTCLTCNKQHHTVLHVDNMKQNGSESGSGLSTSVENSVSAVQISNMVTSSVSCAMAIIPVRVRMHNRTHAVDTYAFFDSGSSASFCSNGLMRRLGVSGKRMKLKLDTMGQPCTMDTYAISGLMVSDLKSQNDVRLPTIYSKDRLPVSKCHIPTQNDLDRWSHLRDIKLPNIDGEIGLMIGSNVPDAYSPVQVRTGPEGSPHATRTRLGWIVWNILRDCEDRKTVVNRAEISAVEQIEEYKDLDKQFKQFINLDFPEKVSEERKENSVEDEKFLKQAESSIAMKDGHYRMNLPFRDRSAEMPNNVQLVHQRLISLKRKMLRNPQFRNDYTQFMNKILMKGYAEPVPVNDLERQDGHVWYIPHHGVYHPQKPGKIRVVFDCSASYMGSSLNDRLLQGPDLTNSLLGVLIRFRQERIGIMGDVEAMFFQVMVSEQDVDCLRFLWWPEGNVELEPVVYRMRVHLFGAVSSPSCSNFALKRTVADNETDNSASVTHSVRRNMYVDDLLASTDSEEEAVSLIKGVTDLCIKGGFRLTKWVSNNDNVLQSVPVDDKADGVKSLDMECSDSLVQRALGVHWFMESDSFGFRIQIRDHSMTRRGILSVVSSIFDPLGLASPFVLMAKNILQDLCSSAVGWDEQISGCTQRSWCEWLSEVTDLENLSVARCYKPVGFGVVASCEIHFFSDASEKGYGVVAYLRLTNEHGVVHCSFLLGKSRVAPLKKVTIPRLELMAATVAVRLSKTIEIELEYNVNQVFFWTDSMSVLRYIANENLRFHTFVANRLAVIRDATTKEQWVYVNTELNPADCASRGQHISTFIRNRQWFVGPEFLWKDKSFWPRQVGGLKEIPSEDTEVRHVTNTVVNIKEEAILDRFVEYFSDWTFLRKAVAWIMTAKENLRNRVKQKKELISKIELRETNPAVRNQRVKQELRKAQQIYLQQSKEKLRSTYLTFDAIRKAEHVLIEYVQHGSFSEELEILSAKSCLKLKKSSPLYRLDPFVKDGLIRVGGRIQRADIPYDAKHPILLPKESRVSRLLLENIHRSLGHVGKNAILAKLREHYWVIGAAAIIKSMFGQCVD